MLYIRYISGPQFKAKNKTKRLPLQFHFDGKVFYVFWLRTTLWTCRPDFYIFKLNRLTVFHVDSVHPTNDHFEPGPVLRDHDMSPLAQFQCWDVFLIIWIPIDVKAD